MNLHRWLPALAVTLVAAAFTWLNRGERAVVDLGVARFYRAPLTLVVFVAFVAGMLSMLLLSLRHDRRVRDELRARGLLDPEPAGPVLALRESTAAPDAPRDDVAPAPLRLEVQPDDGERAPIAREDDVTHVHPADDYDVTRIRPADDHDGRMTRDARIHPQDDRVP